MYKYQSSDKVKFVAEIENPVLTDAICQLRQPLPVKKTGDYITWQMKQEAPIIIDSDTDSDDNSNEEKLIFGGDPDTRFAATKENENDAGYHKYICAKCGKVFRTPAEFRNPFIRLRTGVLYLH